MKYAALILSLLCAGSVWAQDPVQWTLTSEVASAPAGSEVPLRLRATIEPGWHIYSLTIEKAKNSPQATAIKFAQNPSIATFSVYQPKPLRKLDPTINLDTEMFENSAEFWLAAKLAGDAKAGPTELVAEIFYSACDDRRCLRPITKKAAVAVSVDPGASALGAFVAPAGFANIADRAAVAALAGERATDDGLLAFALVAFVAGLAAVFTPCVFPMIPMTVSFFVGQRGGVMQAVVFALGIIILFCGLGLAVTAALGPFGVVEMSSNPWVNGFIAAIFLVFALSLLGAFEITLPSGLLTKMDSASRRGGYLGTLLMGLTFSLTSFACVGPFMGPLLASSLQGGNMTQPVVGMASFATGLASPFFLLAAFPALLKSMPKGGGWLMRVKVVMGFVLLAAMLKYVSNVDQVLQLGWLRREWFLAAWVVLFALPGAYLFGLLRLEGVERGRRPGIGRALVGTAFVLFAASLIPGMFGRALGELEAYIPAPQQSPGPEWMKDQYQEALDVARQQNKLVMVNFTGYACANCHWMKANMFPKPEIAAALGEFVRVELFTDGLDAASEANQKLQERYKTIAQPFYVLMTADEKIVATFEGSTRDVQEYLAFLKRRPA